MRSTTAEAEVRVGVAGDVERVRVVEDVLVVVRAHVPHDNLVALADLLPAQLCVFQRRAAHVQHRRCPADDLLDSLVHQFWLSLQQCELVRVIDKGLHPVGQSRARRLVAGQDQDLEHVAVLERRQLVAIDVGVDQARDEIVGRVETTLLTNLAAVLEHVVRGGTAKR